MYSDSDSGNDSDDSRGGRGMPMDPLLHFFLTGGYLGFGGGRRRGRGGDIDSDDEGGGRARDRKRKPEKPHLPPLPMAEVAHLGLKELKELCKSRYLPVSGTKPALIARLTGGTEPDKVVSFKGPDPVAGLFNFFGIPSSQVSDSYSGFDPPDWETGRECDDPICEPDDNLQATLDDVGAAFRAAATAVAFHFDQVTSLEPPKLRIKTSPEGATTDVTFPLGAEHEQLLARVCKAAPFGRGEETVFDASVRRTLQLDPSEFTVASDAFAAGLASAISDIKAKLAPSSERVEATLYKLLYYPPGSFFRSHVDTQRGQDMFAALVVELQAPQGGGVLRITHDGKSVEIVPRFGTPARVRFTAFYTDCLHEVAEVTAGCRVALIYNLTRSGKAPAAEAPSNPILASVDAAFGEFEEAEDSCEILGYLLAHQYAVTSVMPAALKGSDAALYEVLHSSGKYDLYAAPVVIGELGVGGCGDERRSDVRYMRDSTNFDGGNDGEGGWRETYIIDPRKAPKNKSYVHMHHQPLESLAPLRWINPDPSGLARLLDQDVRPSGNEGTGFAMSYIHYALFLKQKSDEPAPAAAPAAAAAAAAAKKKTKSAAPAAKAAAEPSPASASPAPAAPAAAAKPAPLVAATTAPPAVGAPKAPAPAAAPVVAKPAPAPAAPAAPALVATSPVAAQTSSAGVGAAPPADAVAPPAASADKRKAEEAAVPAAAAAATQGKRKKAAAKKKQS